jgi:hypothetical protein
MERKAREGVGGSDEGDLRSIMLVALAALGHRIDTHGSARVTAGIRSIVARRWCRGDHRWKVDYRGGGSDGARRHHESRGCKHARGTLDPSSVISLSVVFRLEKGGE